MRPRVTILVKLLLAFAVPTLALFTAFAVVALEVTRRDLDAELGTRLSAVAASAATQLRGKYLAVIEADGAAPRACTADDQCDATEVCARHPAAPADGPQACVERAYQNAVVKLTAVADVTGARLYVFDRAFRSRADTAPGVALGTRYYQAELDRVEIGRVLAGGQAASVTFEADDGTQVKAGYAPVHASETEPEVVLVVAAQAPAAYFDRLADLRRSLVWWGAGLAALILAATFGVALLITRPIRTLAAAAARIGGGDLTAPVTSGARDELGVLAETMEAMRAGLAARDARLQQMLAGIAHEVRNPLAGIQLYAGILRDELGDDERAAHAARIDREVAYLERVVRDFLDYARRPPLEPAEVDLAGLVREVAELAAPEADAAGIEIAVEAPAPVTARVDAGAMRRVALNLVRNAVAAAGEAGERGAAVGVGVTTAGARVVLTVWNRGPAISDQVAAQMFEPFFTTREKGTGLGLAFVDQIARAHGGQVEVDRDGPRTRFRVTVPADGRGAGP